MNFISWAFVLLFIPIFLARVLVGARKTEQTFIWLTIVASTAFVMWHVPIYLFVMLTSITVDYLAARRIDREANPQTRKVYLYISMATNLLILGFFKYTDFAFKTAEQLLRPAGIHAHLPRLGLVLPMGISFYTFGSMSYTVDVYRRRIKPVSRFRDFYYFVTFFPHLVAGPIVRAEQFFYQFARTRRLHLRTFTHAGFLIIRGVFLKMVCADNIASVVTLHWPYRPGLPDTSGNLIVLAILFSAQIFCDFEGYSSIARGLAYLMGYRFPLNFDNPYIARSFSDFWGRWHITLSSWLRDYLYIPLGGNRGSLPRTYFNLLAVMLLGGLWHGAALPFLVWGGIQGGALALERGLGLNRIDRFPGIVRVVWYLFVQVTILVAWIFFRSNGVGTAVSMIHHILNQPFGSVNPDLLRATAFLIPVVIMHVYGFLREQGEVHLFGVRASAALAGVMLAAIVLFYGQSSEFIYFQF